MRLSLIIAAHNEGVCLERTVDSCVETCVGLDYEIVIADDDSWDGSVEKTQLRFPQVRIVRHEERHGASPTKDLGARNARGEVLVFLDGHTKPEPSAIERLVEDVEMLNGEAIVTPAVAGLNTDRWKTLSNQVGHGYFLELERFDCGWKPLSELKKKVHRGQAFYESPALIGCALAIHRELYDDLRGFDPHMRSWGVEDLDFGLKSWLLGHPILHDPQAVIGHRFRKQFDNFSVPVEHLLLNQMRMAYKNFTPGVWAEWLERCRVCHSGGLAEHPEGLWACAWQLFEKYRPSADAERSYLMSRRQRDEFWYAERFELLWPRLSGEPIASQSSFAMESMQQGSPSPEPSPSPPPPCNAKLRFLRSNNQEIKPATEALNVSNYVTSVDLPLAANSTFGSTNPDPSNFRLEVEDDGATGNSVKVNLKVGERDAIEYTLDKKSGNKFRGGFLRLVTDTTDDGYRGTQTVLCALGEKVVLTYTRAGEDCKDKLEIQIGRPSTENNNGPDQLKHDIRQVKTRIKVFSLPGTTKLDGAIDASQQTIKVDSVADAHPMNAYIKIGAEAIKYTGIDTQTNEFTGCTRGVAGTTAAAHADDSNVLYSTTTPVFTSMLITDLELKHANERFAQSTIKLNNLSIDDGGGKGIILPPALLNGYKRSLAPLLPTTLSEDEKVIVDYHDNDPNSIDVYYVLTVFDSAGDSIGGTSYPKVANQTGNAKYQNFVVISFNSHLFTLPHEIMHILLNSAHRADPATALFHDKQSTQNGLGATKRIGPYPDDGPGDNDTKTIRDNAEDLP